MPTTTSPRQLFLHELGDVLGAERLILRMLPTLRKEARDAELKKGFQRHERETRQQIQNLERVFKAMNHRPRAQRCPGAEGLKTEHDQFMKNEAPRGGVRDSFLSGAATRTEHYEIAAYTGLITMAKAMGEKTAADLLDRNLKQEKDMLRDAEKIARRLAREGAKQQRALDRPRGRGTSTGGTGTTSRSRARAKTTRSGRSGSTARKRTSTARTRAGSTRRTRTS